jgi:hypothetical protein
MSLWKTIATIFNLGADRPAPADVPYGTQHFSTDTGQLEGSDETQWINLVPGGTTHPHALHDLTDVDPSVTPDKGALLVGDGTMWQYLPPGTDGRSLTTDSTDPLGVVWGGGSGYHIGPWIYDEMEANLATEPMWLLDGDRTGLPLCGMAGVACFVVQLSEPLVAGTATFHLTVDGSTTGCQITFDNSTAACLSQECVQFVDACEVIGLAIDTSSDLDPLVVDATVMVRIGAPPPLDGLKGGTLIRELAEYEGGETTDGGTLIRELAEYEGGTTTDGGTLIREEVVDP